jgi:hypothetical protein
MQPGPQFGPLFHGTAAPLSPGDKVLPPSVAKAGTPNSSRIRNRDDRPDPYTHASASQKERTAWEFAGYTAVRTHGRSVVLKVAQPEDARRGVETKEVVSAQGFPVRDVEHIQPPETVRKPGKNMRYHPNPNGRQGTLPVDFSRLQQTRNGAVYELGDAQGNHPTEADRVRSGDAAPRPSRATPKVEQVARVPGQMMLPGMRGAVKRGRS